MNTIMGQFTLMGSKDLKEIYVDEWFFIFKV
jgi:hypothetical protein